MSALMLADAFRCQSRVVGSLFKAWPRPGVSGSKDNTVQVWVNLGVTVGFCRYAGDIGGLEVDCSRD
jgi:hypothetical protein